MAERYSDNGLAIKWLRDHAAELERDPQDDEVRLKRLAFLASADLLECHDDTGISLDDWWAVRNLVEYCINAPIDENGV